MSKRLIAYLIEPEPEERRTHCNGCYADNVTRILELGTADTHPPRSSSATSFRLCGECLRQVKEVINDG